MNKSKSASYLDSLNIDKMHFGLQAIKALLSRLGNPHKSYPTIIIGGTNGKGSTAAMTASILHRAGYRVGLYTSPHLIDVRERIVVNGKKISQRNFGRTIEHVKSAIKNPITYFEFLTAVALAHFQNEQVDIAVLEVGLGGRLDATNVGHPLVSVITNIALDHTAYLGGTLQSIAYEKAGIIKRNSICVTGAKQKTVLDMLEKACRKRRTKLYRLGRDIKIKKQANSLLTYEGLRREVKNLAVPLRGDHQQSNAALALATIEICATKGFPVDDNAIHDGLRKTRWDARMEILQEKPLFLLDGAHNPAGMDSLCRFLKKEFSDKKIIVIFGALADKDYRGMLKKIVPLSQKIILTGLHARRSAPLSAIRDVVCKMGRKPVVVENVRQAIQEALKSAGRQNIICATGSFYLAGEIKQAFPEITLYGSNNTAKKP
ncbi:MAG: folylpolyglutamate synthase/dihydrofolate synthase family protein [Smithella sp.]|nr:folylpolyglutamate synthase/dihydrofolate synthase family protein [Smithella sp.]